MKSPIQQLPFVTNVTDGIKSFDTVLALLEQAYDEIQRSGAQNKTVAKIAKEAHKTLTMFLGITKELDKNKKQNNS